MPMTVTICNQIDPSPRPVTDHRTCAAVATQLHAAYQQPVAAFAAYEFSSIKY